MWNGQTAFAAALLLFGTTTLLTHATTMSARAIILAFVVADLALAWWARHWHIPSEKFMHTRVVPGAFGLGLLSLISALAWRL